MHQCGVHSSLSHLISPRSATFQRMYYSTYALVMYPLSHHRGVRERHWQAMRVVDTCRIEAANCHAPGGCSNLQEWGRRGHSLKHARQNMPLSAHLACSVVCRSPSTATHCQQPGALLMKPQTCCILDGGPFIAKCLWAGELGTSRTINCASRATCMLFRNEGHRGAPSFWYPPMQSEPHCHPALFSFGGTPWSCSHGSMTSWGWHTTSGMCYRTWDPADSPGN